MFEFVENDTLPVISGTITEDDGVTPINLFGYTISLHIGYNPPLVKYASIIDSANGIFEFPWGPGELKAGTWAAEIQIVSPEGIKTIQKSIGGVPLEFEISGEIA